MAVRGDRHRRGTGTAEAAAHRSGDAAGAAWPVRGRAGHVRAAVRPAATAAAAGRDVPGEPGGGQPRDLGGHVRAGDRGHPAQLAVGGARAAPGHDHRRAHRGSARAGSAAGPVAAGAARDPGAAGLRACGGARGRDGVPGRGGRARVLRPGDGAVHRGELDRRPRRADRGGRPGGPRRLADRAGLRGRDLGDLRGAVRAAATALRALHPGTAAGPRPARHPAAERDRRRPATALPGLVRDRGLAGHRVQLPDVPAERAAVPAVRDGHRVPVRGVSRRHVQLGGRRAGGRPVRAVPGAVLRRCR